MRALNRLNYAAVGIGNNEMAIPLIDALSEYSLNNPSPQVLAANLLNRVENFPSQAGQSMVGAWQMVSSDRISSKPGAARSNLPKVGVVGIVADSVEKGVMDPTVQFAPVAKALPAAVSPPHAPHPDLPALPFH